MPFWDLLLRLVMLRQANRLQAVVSYLLEIDITVIFSSNSRKRTGVFLKPIQWQWCIYFRCIIESHTNLFNVGTVPQEHWHIGNDGLLIWWRACHICGRKDKLISGWTVCHGDFPLVGGSGDHLCDKEKKRDLALQAEMTSATHF